MENKLLLLDQRDKSMYYPESPKVRLRSEDLYHVISGNGVPELQS